jgi:hypothetical protein
LSTKILFLWKDFFGDGISHRGAEYTEINITTDKHGKTLKEIIAGGKEMKIIIGVRINHTEFLSELCPAFTNPLCYTTGTPD